MDTPSTTPNADAPYIQCARAIDLTPAQVALLQEAFADKTKVMVEQQFSGYSGAAIYLITCDGQAPVVVKLDHPYHIRQEYAAYQQFVRSQLGLIAARIEQAPVIHEQHQMGLLVYTFMGVDPAQPASSLFDYYQQQGGKATVAILHLIFDYGKLWWSYRSTKRIFPYEEYDWLLPADVQLQVSAAHLPEDQLLQAQAINLAMLRQLQPGQAVRLEGFQVIKVRPDGLTLSTSASPGQLPVPPYLRLVGQLDTAYQPGEVLASQVARVEATQFTRLAAYAAHSLPTLDPTQDYFLLEGRRYRNPLAALPELLDQPYETNYSIIHGDLNLQNIMVMAQREQHARFAWLIDFAQTRRGPTLLDLQRLEVQIITKLLPANLKPAQLITLLEALHTKSPDTRSPLPALQEPYLVLAALRRLLPKYMFDHDHWGEYYRGLALVLLGTLKFEELADVARQRALLAAAIVLDLAEKPSLSPAHPWREWVRHAVSALLLLVILALVSASTIQTPIQLPTTLTSVVRPTAISSIAQRYWTEPTFNMRFVYVPTGTFRMGSLAGAGGSDEYPPHVVQVDAFWMSATEVTNQQYSFFVKANGYQQEEWWAETEKTWRAEVKRQQPAYWSDSQWNQPDYPVVGISWYEALAYTNWLSHTLNLRVRLPTEAEWERAARGDDDRIYPWGNELPDKVRGNFDGNVGRATPVGVYPQGASPYGVLDMAGNVWEWTSSQYMGYPYVVNDGRENLTGASGRVVRGGSWKDRLNSVRAASRRHLNAGTWGTGLGIRLVIHGELPTEMISSVPITSTATITKTKQR